jgi:pyruvate,water dikinase
MAIGWLRRRRHEPAGVDVLRERLDRFRDLVDKNNQVLELIAGGGEMLGGEYIFDIQYMRTLAEELHESCHAVVDDLNSVTRNRFPELVLILNRISADVHAILDSRVLAPEADYIIPLDALDDAMADVAGAKIARLGGLRRRLGVRVPEGFVITTAACEHFLHESGIWDRMEEYFSSSGPYSESELRERAARLREKVLSARLPRDLVKAISAHSANLASRTGSRLFAVRSSALGEDSELSFAGQFATVLGVAPQGVEEAYREVVASMFSANVMSYRQRHGLHAARGLMAVGCLCMVPARAGGVLYSLDPVNPGRERIVITVTHGLGKAVVDGSAPADRLQVSRSEPYEVIEREVARKETMLVAARGGGVAAVGVVPEERDKAALSDAEAASLAAVGLAIERDLKCAVDVEWAVDDRGRLFILQARPLRISRFAAQETDVADVADTFPMLISHQGAVACSGVASGPVVVIGDEEALDEVPAGAVLVARTSSPRLSSAVARAAAVVTDVGTTTGHLATIAREFRVPTIVDAGNATRVLADAGVVTVDADSNCVFEGRVEALLRDHLLRASAFEDTNEFRMLRRMLRRVAPLNLRDPRSHEFTANNCTTYHDVIRFAHEKAVQELAEGDWIEPSQRSRCVFRLDIKIPLDLVIVDLGGGVSASCVGRKKIGSEDITSVPLGALIEGLVKEGVWATEPTNMDPNALMASMTRATPWMAGVASRPQNNLAIASRQYLNLNLRLGYHFNIIDCFVGEARNDNYIYFRFAGGVTEQARRTRRAILLRRILEANDFVAECRSDLVIGRIKKISEAAMLQRLEMLGQLIGYTRQLDVLLSSEESIGIHLDRFMSGRFMVESGS